MLGVVPSDTRTNGNPSMDMHDRTGVVLSVSTVVFFVVLGVKAPCVCSCASIMTRDASYIEHVCEIQYHIYGGEKQ